MSADIVFTLTGPDRVGLVEEVTGAFVELGGNVESSRMARLGGEFAILMLVTLPDEHIAKIEASLSALTSAGYKITTSRTGRDAAVEHTGWPRYRVEVRGADHEGIIHDIAHGLSASAINVESMDTETTPAPVSGTPLFSLRAIVAVPPSLSPEGWRAELEHAASQANVDVTVIEA